MPRARKLPPRVRTSGLGEPMRVDAPAARRTPTIMTASPLESPPRRAHYRIAFGPASALGGCPALSAAARGRGRAGAVSLRGPVAPRAANQRLGARAGGDFGRCGGHTHVSAATPRNLTPALARTKLETPLAALQPHCG